MQIQDIINVLEDWAPRSYQESYDNSGLLTGDRRATCTGVLISLDMTEDVVQEAIEKGCNLLVAHHPVIFKGLKSLTGDGYVQRTVLKAIKNDVALYAIHTNLDNVHTGVNRKIAEVLGLEKCRILQPKRGILQKLTVFTPAEAADRVKAAMFHAGAGKVGNYDQCSFSTGGTGSFRPGEEANPAIGRRGEQEYVTETRTEVILPGYASGKILAAMQAAHPYEEVSYFLSSLENINQEVGAGMVGELPEAMDSLLFLEEIRNRMQAGCVRYTDPVKEKVKRVAVCGGVGSFLLNAAKKAKADVFITADYKYHEFFDADGDIMIVDIGHYESEAFTKDLIYDLLNKKLTNIAFYLSERRTNPINYL